MALLGQAALAMWWDVAAGMRPEFEHWHSHEHFSERLGVPGFRRATRWADATGGEGIFVMYELTDYEVLSSAAYLACLNAPTPWSTRMMPHHRNMVRSQCRVLHSRGAALARHALTVRLSPAEPDGARLLASLDALLAGLPGEPGLTGAHLLRHQTPAIAPTTEQRLRGGDATADWVLVVTGYDGAAVRDAAQARFADAQLVRMGAAPAAVQGLYRLSASATPADVA